jgi:hypothetical protein
MFNSKKEKDPMKALLCFAVLCLSLSAHAGESLFGRAYTTETVPMGHFELEQAVRNRTQRAFGTYSATDFKSEFEYGVTDNFQVAFYVNTELLNANNAPDDNDVPEGDQPGGLGFSRHSFFVQSLSTEFIYRILSPVADPIGLALYYEPEWDFYDMHNGRMENGSLENEFRLLLQKDLLGDRLILVYNLVLELEYFRYGPKETHFMGELDWNNEIGATYRFASNWYAGLEARNHNELGNFWSHDHSVYWAGPVVHYGSANLWATLSVMKQVYGCPSGLDEAGSDQGPSGYFLHSHEMWESTLKVGLPF